MSIPIRKPALSLNNTTLSDTVWAKNKKRVSEPVCSVGWALGAGESGLGGVVGGKFEFSGANLQQEFPITLAFSVVLWLTCKRAPDVGSGLLSRRYKPERPLGPPYFLPGRCES